MQPVYPIYKAIDNSFINWKNLLSNENATLILRQFHESKLNRIDIPRLLQNPCVVELFEKMLFTNFISSEYLKYLCKNPSKKAMKLVEANLERLSESDWINLSQNPFAIDIINANLDKIDKYAIFANPAAMHLIPKFFDLYFNKNPRDREGYISDSNRYIINFLGRNTNPEAIKMIYPYLMFLDFRSVCRNPNAVDLAYIIFQYCKDPVEKSYYMNQLCQNPNAMHIIRMHLDILNEYGWYYLSENPNATDILKENPSKINFGALATNPKAIDLIEQNLDIIRFRYPGALCLNPNALHLLFTYEYTIMRDNTSNFAREVIASALHPDKLEFIANQFNMDFLQVLESR